MLSTIIRVLVIFSVFYELECSLWNYNQRNNPPSVQYHYHGEPCDKCPCEKTLNVHFEQPVEKEKW
jgi:hypothetical protein